MKYILTVSQPSTESMKNGLPASMFIKLGEDWYESYLAALTDEIQIITELDIETLNNKVRQLFTKTDKREGVFWCKIKLHDLAQVEQ